MSVPPPPAEDPAPPGAARILLVRLSHLGDVVHALPVYHALRRAHPDARFAWVVQDEFADLLEHLPGCELRIPFDRRGGLAAWPRLRRALGAFDATWTVDAQGNWKSALATRLSGAPRRSGPADGDWREPSARWLVPDRPPAAAPAPHAVDRMLHLAQHLAPGAWSGDAERAGTPRDLRAAGAFDLGLPAFEQPRAGEPDPRQLPEDSVLLALGRPGDPRTWPAGHARDLARILAGAGWSVVLLSGPAEEPAGRELERELAEVAGIHHWVGQRGLARLASWMEAAAGRGVRYVGSDSGPMHLAWAMGLEVLCLAGPQDPARTGPWPPPGPGSPHRVVTAPFEDEPLSCRPCLARTCGHGRGPVCLTELAPARVAELLLDR